MIALLIFYFAITIVISFLCSLWEAVLLSVTPSYAQIQMSKGTRIGRQLQSFKENIDRPLTAILTLNTIAHTVGAIGVGAQATRIWEHSQPVLAGVVVPVLMTLGVLILSEIIPKTLGANYWQELAPITVRSLQLVIPMLLPLVWLGQLITRTLTKEKAKSVLSRSDFAAMTEIGASQGLFRQAESEIIRSLLRFHAVRARDVMTPRTVVKAAPEEQTLREFHDANPNLRFSRIPIYQADSKDQITGYVLKDEMLARLVSGGPAPKFREIKREITVVSESFPIPDLFSRFMETREHIALVVDEFGGTAGIVTMEDVIETLLGLEIVDELDSTDDMQKLARRNWERRARSQGLFWDSE